MATKAELLAEAAGLGLNLDESMTNAQIQEAITEARKAAEVEAAVADVPTVTPEEVPVDEPVEAVEDVVVPEPVKSEGSEIASAIREGLAGAKDGNKIRITADKSVKSMFSVVRSKRTGEIMIRENATGTLSKVQLQSLEEKEASLQGEDVEPLI